MLQNILIPLTRIISLHRSVKAGMLKYQDFFSKPPQPVKKTGGAAGAPGKANKKIKEKTPHNRGVFLLYPSQRIFAPH
jgi:hypothetical protein